LHEPASFALPNRQRVPLDFGRGNGFETVAGGQWTELDEWPDFVFSAQKTGMGFGRHRIILLRPYKTFHYPGVLAIKFLLANYITSPMNACQNQLPYHDER